MRRWWQRVLLEVDGVLMFPNPFPALIYRAWPWLQGRAAPAGWVPWRIPARLSFQSITDGLALPSTDTRGPGRAQGSALLPVPPKFTGFFSRTGRSDIFFSTMDARKTHFQVPSNSTLAQELKIFLIQQEKELREHLLFMELGSVHY